MPLTEKDLTYEEAWELYWNRSMSLDRIGAKFGVHAGTVWDHLKRLGIPIRSHAESQFLRRGAHSGDRNPQYKNGRTQNGPEGYVFILKPNHPRAHQNYVREHLLVWEEANGKPLPEGWVIHHLNGIKNDNRIENLVALPAKKHRYVLRETAKRVRQLEAEVQSLQERLAKDKRPELWP